MRTEHCIEGQLQRLGGVGVDERRAERLIIGAEKAACTRRSTKSATRSSGLTAVSSCCLLIVHVWLVPPVKPRNYLAHKEFHNFWKLLGTQI